MPIATLERFSYIGKVCCLLFVQANYLGPRPRARPRGRSSCYGLCVCVCVCVFVSLRMCMCMCALVRAHARLAHMRACCSSIVHAGHKWRRVTSASPPSPPARAGKHRRTSCPPLSQEPCSGPFYTGQPTLPTHVSVLRRRASARLRGLARGPRSRVCSLPRSLALLLDLCPGGWHLVCLWDPDTPPGAGPSFLPLPPSLSQHPLGPPLSTKAWLRPDLAMQGAAVRRGLTAQHRPNVTRRVSRPAVCDE